MWSQTCATFLTALKAQTQKSHLPFLTEVSHEIVSRETSRNPLVTLSLRRGAHFEIARATLSTFWACQTALNVARCSFCYSRRSCAEILARMVSLESLRRDLATEASYKDLVQRPLKEILYRYLGKRSLTEVLPTDLLQRSCQESSYKDLVQRSLTQIWPRDLF